MVDRISNFANAFQTTLAASMSAVDTVASVITTVGAPTSPCYLVIEPDSASNREYIYFDGAFTGTTFVTTTTANRFLAGSAAASGLSHAAGSVVRVSPMAQHFEDLHDRVTAEATARTAADTAHTGAADPHTGYVLESLVDAVGDLIVGSGADAVARLAAGTDGQVLTVQADGTLAYEAPTSVSKAARTATVQSIPNATLTVVTFDSAPQNAEGMWSAGAPTRLTVQRAGRYLVLASMRYAASADTGLRLGRIRLNGTTLLDEDQRPNQSGWHGHATFGNVFRFTTVGDYLELLVRQDSGAALDTANSDYYPSLTAVYLSP